MNESRKRAAARFHVIGRASVWLIALWLACAFALAQDQFEQVERIVAIGDVHGGFTQLTGLLRSADVLDGRNRWKGGKTHFVQAGDILDRGPDSRKVMDLLMDLERQSQKEGGRVHLLLGNHEAMNLYGDLRYVSHEEYDSYRTPESAQVRDQAYESMANPSQKSDRKYRKQWEDEHPLGWVEHRQAFGQTGRYGKWLRQKNAVLKLNDILFVHGGISPKCVSMTIQDINSRIRAELQDFRLLSGGLAMDGAGPLWYRGMAQDPEADLGPHVDAVLKAFAARFIVIAHTPTPGVVLPRFGGKVIMIDVGVSKIYGEVAACLMIEGGEPFAMHRGFRLRIPVGTDQAAYLAYLRTAESHDPPDSPLHRFVRNATR